MRTNAKVMIVRKCEEVVIPANRGPPQYEVYVSIAFTRT